MNTLTFEANPGVTTQIIMTAADWKRTEKYCSNIESLMKQPFFKRAPTLNKISMFTEFGFDVSISDYDKTALQAALLEARFVILQDEPYNFLKTQSLIKKLCPDQGVRGLLKEWTSIFQDGEFSRFGNIFHQDLGLFSDKAFALWLNSKVYHQDISKEAAYTGLTEVFGIEPVEKIMVLLFSDKWGACLRLYGAIGKSVRAAG
jgi:hypothetical protein